MQDDSTSRNPWADLRRPDFDTELDELDWRATPVSLDRGRLSDLLEERQRLAAAVLETEQWAGLAALGRENLGLSADVVALAERIKAEG